MRRMNSALPQLNKVLEAVRTIRVQSIKYEVYIHNEIKRALDAHGIPYHHEYKLAPRNRIDFLAAGGIGIEVKKGKPYSEEVNRQLQRYTAFEEVNGIILVIERYQDVPEEFNGKPCRSIGLRKLWGIASK